MSMFNDGFGGGAPMDEANTDGVQGGGAPAPAPVAAQAAPTNDAQPQAVPTPAPEENASQEAKQEGPAPVQYAETGDPTLDYVLGYVGSLGMDAEHPAIQAAANGEFDLLGVELAKADAKGAENILAMVKRTYENYTKQAEEKSHQLKEKVLGIVGGEEQWQGIQTWAAENATQDERDTINQLFQQGGFAAEMAATYLASQYRGATGTAYEGKPAASPAAAQPAPATGKLSNVEFAQAAQKLYQQYGNAYTNTSEYRALAARMR